MAARRQVTGARLNIEGTKDFRKLARGLARTPAAMARAERSFYVAAARTVEAMARDEAHQRGGIAAKSAKDVRSGKPGTVVYGGQGYSMGAEFGSYRYKQFKIWRGNGDDAGYFLWPSIRQFRDKRFVDMWQKQVWRVVRHEFLYS